MKRCDDTLKNAMQDPELKKLLLETCPVRPGQEARAWTALQERLSGASAKKSDWRWLYFPTGKGFTASSVVALGLAALLVAYISGFEAGSVGSATADSQAPGIYATAFYSKPAQAQVVWLNGMEPATDKPTYLDPTTVLPKKSSQPARDPNSL